MIMRGNILSIDHLNCLTVDVEDYFQVSAFADRVSRHDWDRYTSRVQANTNRLLSIFDSAQVLGTFFVLGWVAERYPALVRRIAEAGHEIASHGYWHQLVYDLEPKEFEADIVASREAIFNACGVEVSMYRAPSFSIVPRSRWALDILVANGFKVDSSIFPIAGHDRYGDPDAPRSIHTIETTHGTIVEFPPTSGGVGRLPIPIGGGYFRLLPLRLTQFAINQVNKKVSPAMIYLHPWEIDPDQPRIGGVSKKSYFRHYTGLRNTEAKLQELLKTNRFSTVSNVLKSQSSVRVSTHSPTPDRKSGSRRNNTTAIPSQLPPSQPSPLPMAGG